MKGVITAIVIQLKNNYLNVVMFNKSYGFVLFYSVI